MISFEEAGRILDEAVDALPEEIFKDLNGGVNLINRRVIDRDGLVTMGMYFIDRLGRRVEIYYGSFKEAFYDELDSVVRDELILTLKHELTHHIENLAGDRSLEHWDEENRHELLSQYYDD